MLVNVFDAVPYVCTAVSVIVFGACIFVVYMSHSNSKDKEQ